MAAGRPRRQYSIGKVTLKLPPSSAWGTRTQTLSVQTSTDGSTLRHGRRLGDLHVHLADQRGEHHRAGDRGPLRAGQHHGQHRLAGRARRRSSRSTRAAAPRRTRRRCATNPSSLTFATQALNTTSAGPGGDGHQHRYRGGRRLRGLGQRRLPADQHLRDVDRRRGVVHGQRQLPADRVRYADRHADRSPATRRTARRRSRCPAPGPAPRQHQPRRGQADQRVQPHRRVPVEQRHRRRPEHATGRAPTTRSRSGCRSTSARPRAPAGSCVQLPAAWGARNQTFSVLGQHGRLDFTTVTASASYAFDPAQQQHRHDHVHRDAASATGG